MHGLFRLLFRACNNNCLALYEASNSIQVCSHWISSNVEIAKKERMQRSLQRSTFVLQSKWWKIPFSFSSSCLVVSARFLNLLQSPHNQHFVLHQLLAAFRPKYFCWTPQCCSFSLNYVSKRLPSDFVDFKKLLKCETQNGTTTRVMDLARVEV